MVIHGRKPVRCSKRTVDIHVTPFFCIFCYSLLCLSGLFGPSNTPNTTSLSVAWCLLCTHVRISLISVQSLSGKYRLIQLSPGPSLFISYMRKPWKRKDAKAQAVNNLDAKGEILHRLCTCANSLSGLNYYTIFHQELGVTKKSKQIYTKPQWWEVLALALIHCPWLYKERTCSLLNFNMFCQGNWLNRMQYVFIRGFNSAAAVWAGAVCIPASSAPVEHVFFVEWSAYQTTSC